MEIIVGLFLLAIVALGIAYVADPSCVIPDSDGKFAASALSRLIVAGITLLLALFLFNSCSGFLASSGRSHKSSPTTAEEAASQYYYDKNGHIRIKD